MLLNAIDISQFPRIHIDPYSIQTWYLYPWLFFFIIILNSRTNWKKFKHFAVGVNDTYKGVILFKKNYSLLSTRYIRYNRLKIKQKSIQYPYDSLNSNQSTLLVGIIEAQGTIEMIQGAIELINLVG